MKNFEPDSYFILHANCLPVKGARRSLVCDLQRGHYHYIPNALYDLLQETRRVKIGEVYAQFDEADQKILDEYFSFLLDTELGVIDSEPALFPTMDLDWDAPSTITNAVIDIDEAHFPGVNYAKAFKELDQLNCFCVQIRSFVPVGMEAIEELLSFTLDSRLNEVRLVLAYDPETEEYIKEKLLTSHKRVSEILFFNAPENTVKKQMDVQLIYLDLPEMSEMDCGQVCTGLFSVNIPHFTEALQFNSCLNRKIALDPRGYIKNCPSQSINFGHINETTFEEVILNKQFSHLWKIKKDDISVCKDCEYRYICTDCRVFLSDPDDPYSKPSKCTYDPYTATWN